MNSSKVNDTSIILNTVANDTKDDIATEYEEDQQSEEKKRGFKKVKSDDETKRTNKKFSDKSENKNYRAEATKTKQVKTQLFDKTQVPVLNDMEIMTPFTESVFSGLAIDSLDIHPHAIKNLKDVLHFTELTSVQSKTIPLILEGRDALIRSQTGSGKTLAYALPVIEKLCNIQPRLTRSSGIQALVIVPTRELAVQSYELFLKLLKPFQWIVPGYLSGGEKRKSEKARLRNGINILVATPGRLCDHLINTESLRLDHVKHFILDEADRLFELGYEKDVKKIVETLNAHKEKSKVKPEGDDAENAEEDEDASKATDSNEVQAVLLSATLSDAVKELAGLTLTNPLFIDASDKANTIKNSATAFDNALSEENLIIPSGVTQTYVIVPPKLRLVTLCGMIARESRKKDSKILVFMATQHLVDYHYDVMVDVLTQKKMDSDDEHEEDDEDESDEDNDDDAEILLPNISFFK